MVEEDEKTKRNAYYWFTQNKWITEIVGRQTN